MNSPSEYVDGLRSELRALRVEIARLADEKRDLLELVDLQNDCILELRRKLGTLSHGHFKI